MKNNNNLANDENCSVGLSNNKLIYEKKIFIIHNMEMKINFNVKIELLLLR